MSIPYSTLMAFTVFSFSIRKKTRFSFTSSNSSFTECVRKHLSSKYSYVLQSNACEQNCQGQNLGTRRVSLDSSSTHTFTSCSWKDCKSAQGPAISFRSRTSSSLTVDQCSFDSCNSTSSVRQDGGGAINAYQVKNVRITSSLFYSCKCTSFQLSTEGQLRSGGGVLLHSVTETPLVKMCIFISCEVLDDAGGLGIYSCGNNLNAIPVQDSRFISCYCNDSSGAYEFQLSTCKMCSSCLYCGCTSKGSGGVSWIRFNRTTSEAEISFSLYHENVGN